MLPTSGSWAAALCVDGYTQLPSCCASARKPWRERLTAVQLDRPGPALCGASCLFVLHILQRGRLAGRGRAGEDHIDIDPWIGWAMHIALSNSRGVGCAALLVPHFTYQQPKGPGARGKGYNNPGGTAHASHIRLLLFAITRVLMTMGLPLSNG
jgi:hypothetical protein